MNRPDTRIPTYKPSPQIQELIDKELPPQQRRRTAVIPKRSWIQRNPKLFQITFITTSLLILFSKPLYDAFIAPAVPLLPNEKPIPAHKR